MVKSSVYNYNIPFVCSFQYAKGSSSAIANVA